MGHGATTIVGVLEAASLAVASSQAIALSSAVYVFFFVSTPTLVDRRMGWFTLALTPSRCWRLST